ncbi:hypothetical protein B0H13DRAFT_2350731 [Mycena leptocephala]|nr:hypothetical protein B0H13DRAFT_2350731 [Mycena leptocephala]
MMAGMVTVCVIVPIKWLVAPSLHRRFVSPLFPLPPASCTLLSLLIWVFHRVLDLKEVITPCLALLPSYFHPRTYSLKLTLLKLSQVSQQTLGASLSGFKHGQNETITFNLKRAEDPEEDFAFVQGAVVRLHCRVQPFKTSPSPPHRPLRLMSLSNPQRWVDHPARAP